MLYVQGNSYDGWMYNNYWNYSWYWGGQNLDALVHVEPLDTYSDKLIAQIGRQSNWADPANVAPWAGAVGGFNVSISTQTAADPNGAMPAAAGIDVNNSDQTETTNSLAGIKALTQQAVTKDRHVSGHVETLLAFAPPEAASTNAVFDETAPNWGWGIGPMTHSSHSITMQFPKGTNAGALQTAIYNGLKEFENFDSNIVDLTKTGSRAHFSLNGFPWNWPNSIDVQLVNDPKNSRVIAVTVGKHPLVGVRIWQVKTTTAADGTVSATITTEAYERTRFIGDGTKLPVVGGPVPPSSNLLAKAAFGWRLQSHTWEIYLRNISTFWSTTGLGGMKATEWQRTVLFKSNNLNLTDAQNPFRSLLPANLQQNHPQAS